MRNLDFDEYVFLFGVILILVLIGFATRDIIRFNRYQEEHQKFLSEHGCQEIHRSEYVVVFECKDGMKTELQH